MHDFQNWVLSFKISASLSSTWWHFFEEPQNMVTNSMRHSHFKAYNGITYSGSYEVWPRALLWCIMIPSCCHINTSIKLTKMLVIYYSDVSFWLHFRGITLFLKWLEKDHFRSKFKKVAHHVSWICMNVQLPSCRENLIFFISIFFPHLLKSWVKVMLYLCHALFSIPVHVSLW